MQLSFPSGRLLPSLLLCCCSAGTAERSQQVTPGASTPESRPPSAAPEPAAAASDPGGPIEPAPGTGRLASSFAEHFGIGAAVEPHHLRTASSILSGDFNRLTAENAMKFAPIHPSSGSYAFEAADTLADFAREHAMKMTGHALVWYRETPAWLVSAGDAEATREALGEHIQTVVGRYADVVDNWDVVNEAISDSPDKIYRDGDEGSKLYALYEEDYIPLAFELADAAAEETGKEIALYYNDYNVVVPGKLEKILTMVRWLQAQGVRVDGVGMQAHWNIEWPSDAQIQDTIDQLVAEGLKVKISELDLSIYTADDHGAQRWEPEKPFTPELAERQAKRYAELFTLFKNNAEHITSVTFWGISDDATWLDDFPAPGRNNHPLLFDDDGQPKPAYFAILEAQ